MGPSRGPLIPPLMGPSTPPLMGPSGGEGAVGAGHGSFQQVRTQESARSIERPSMGLLRRPTPGGIVEGGRFSRPCGPGAHSRAISENQPAATPSLRPPVGRCTKLHHSVLKRNEPRCAVLAGEEAARTAVGSEHFIRAVDQVRQDLVG